MFYILTYGSSTEGVKEEEEEEEEEEEDKKSSGFTIDFYSDFLFKCWFILELHNYIYMKLQKYV